MTAPITAWLVLVLCLGILVGAVGVAAVYQHRQFEEIDNDTRVLFSRVRKLECEVTKPVHKLGCGE